MLRVMTSLGALGRLCCKVVASTEKTEVLLDGSVARLSHRRKRRRRNLVVVSMEKTIGQFLAASARPGGEASMIINYSRYPAFILVSWCLGQTSRQITLKAMAIGDDDT